MTNRIYAIGFAIPYQLPFQLVISGISICNSVDVAIQKLYRGAGFKNIKDYVRSYPGKFKTCRNNNLVIMNIREKQLSYKSDDGFHYVNTPYWTYGKYRSQCLHVIRDLQDDMINVVVIPKTSDLNNDIIGTIRHEDPNTIGCFCSDWMEDVN